MSARRNRASPAQTVLLGILSAGVLLAACGACWAIYAALFPGSEAVTTTPGQLSPPSALRVAYSPEKQQLFEALVQEFNRQQLTGSTGEALEIQTVQMDPETMIEAALRGDVQAIVPDSSLWLDVLDRTYEEQTSGAESGTPRQATTQVTRWAVSPVVIAMWEETARQLGWPDQPIGWKTLLDRAQNDPNFKWSHASTSSASGLLATLAQFYAGAGMTRGLTEDQARSSVVADYVGAIQKTVRFYGEGEWPVIERALREGQTFLDAFVVQEQLVIYFNRQAARPGQLVAIYPAEGTLWEDHPLALVEAATPSLVQRETYRAFREYLTSQAVQERVLEAGYRPADLSVRIDGPTSPISRLNGADPTQPQTTLQVPGPGVVQIVRDVWWLTKRHTNIYLIADTSGSMEGDKLARAQEALLAFLEQIRGDRERVGLIAFASSVYKVVELDELGVNRSRLIGTIRGLQARGDTALLDAVSEAYSRLQYLRDTQRINAILVMTDGKENNSRTSLYQLVDQIQRGNQAGVPVIVFCIAYGDDADMYTLEQLAGASGGQVRTGDLETIRGLYKVLSTYF